MQAFVTGKCICSGSKRNWGSFLKAFHRDMPERPIYALDLRNHGASPHARPMTYEAMVEDVNRFVESRNLKNVSILGHSMSAFFHWHLLYVSDATFSCRGGKVAMAYALSKPRNLSNLVFVDIAPSIADLSPEFVRYISLMQEIENLPPGKVKKRSDADEILSSRGIVSPVVISPKSQYTENPAGHIHSSFPLDKLAYSPKV